MGQTLPVIGIVTFLGFVDTHMLIPIIALYTTELGATVGVVGLIIGLYSIVNTPANIVFGRIVDKFGRKKPLIVGLFGDAVCMFLYSLCRVPGHLALVRVLHGATGAIVGPATMSLVADHASTHRRGRAMGVYGLSMGLAVLIGYGISGVVATRLGYAPLFYIGSVLLLAGGLFAFLVPGSKASTSVKATSSLGEDIAKIGDLLKRKRLIASYYCTFAQYFTFGSLVVLFPLYVKGLGMSAFHVAMLLMTLVIVFMLSQLPSGVLSDKVGRKTPAIAGLSLVSAGLCIIPICTTFSALVFAMTIYGLGWGLLFPSISALIADNTTADERGMATGGFHALLTGGVAVGAPVMAGVAALVGLERGLVLSSLATVLGIFIVLALVRSSNTKLAVEEVVA